MSSGATLDMPGKQLKRSAPPKRRNRTKAGQESGNASTPRPLDRRIRRSRDLLGDALVALMQEKPFAEITIKKVLARAGISRSTFYSHYTGKDDLLLSDAEEFFTAMASHMARTRENSTRLVPVTEMLNHLRDAHTFYRALVASGKKHEVMELGEGLFASGIAQRLALLRPQLTVTQREKLARFAAGAFMGVLSWWIQHRMEEPPETIDRFFHQTVWQGINLVPFRK